MRTTRALIAGFGTTGTLVAAAACVFVVVSAVIAFNTWPGSGLENSIDSLFAKDQPAVAFDVAGPQAVAGDAAAAAALVAVAPSGPVSTGPAIGPAGQPLGPGS